jgi:hypothetical protein
MGLPIYGTREGLSSRVSSRFSVSTLIAFPFRLERPIAFTNHVEADVACTAATASMLCAIPAMPNSDFLLRLALGASACRLRVKPLRSQRAGNRFLPGKKARK